MPMGSFHDETGLLLREGRWLVLQLDGGGRWRLDTLKRVDKLMGQRVRVQGTRGDFDLLDVKRIELWKPDLGIGAAGTSPVGGAHIDGHNSPEGLWGQLKSALSTILRLLT